MLMKRISDQIDENQREAEYNTSKMKEKSLKEYEELTFKISKCALQTSLEDLQDTMKEYARFDHIRQLRADVLPKVENFTKLLDIYTKDNIDMRECIEKFDKTLSLKSNKADIITMKH